jgi:hypothetical protein
MKPLHKMTKEELFQVPADALYKDALRVGMPKEDAKQLAKLHYITQHGREALGKLDASLFEWAAQ